MSLTNIIPQTDHIANACAAIDNKYVFLLQHIASTLEESISLIDKNDDFTPAEFWARQGSNGGNLIIALATWREILSKYAPQMISERISGAGSTLEIDRDGHVSPKPA
jgi:hypothetical protein